MRFNKKASLEISIQAIVIVVLAMTLLGLGLGFIRGMFRNIGSTTEDVTEQVRQKILDDLITGDKKLSFPKTSVDMDKGGSTVLTVGIRNKNNADLYYRMRFTPISYTSGDGTQVGTFDIDNPRWFQLAESEFKLKPADAEVRSIRLSIPRSVPSGSYFLTFDVIDTSDITQPYAQKDFFINVRG